jgi:hypothetical protein
MDKVFLSACDPPGAQTPRVELRNRTASRRKYRTPTTTSIIIDYLDWEVATGFGATRPKWPFRPVDGPATSPGNFTTRFVATHGIFPASSRAEMAGHICS